MTKKHPLLTFYLFVWLGLVIMLILGVRSFNSRVDNSIVNTTQEVKSALNSEYGINSKDIKFNNFKPYKYIDTLFYTNKSYAGTGPIIFSPAAFKYKNDNYTVEYRYRSVTGIINHIPYPGDSPNGEEWDVFENVHGTLPKVYVKKNNKDITIN